MGTEQPAEFYTGDKYMMADIYNRYEPLYLQAADFLPNVNRCPKIVDLGCGVGHFAGIIWNRGYRDYLGIDFSSRMLKRARRKVPRFEFIRRNLLDESLQEWFEKKQLFVLLEVLEHINDDLSILENIPIGSQVIFSVPSFDARSHVRKFKNTGAVIARYKHLLNFNKIVQWPWSNDNKVFMFNCERV
jgi:SAM-dependent methyltransferase